MNILWLMVGFVLGFACCLLLPLTFIYTSETVERLERQLRRMEKEKKEKEQ